MSHNPIKDATDWSVVADFKSLLNFKVIFFKSGLVKPVYSWICRHENIKMILVIQLWERGTQRLHQGMSETIFVNTLTDVREFKNYKSLNDRYSLFIHDRRNRHDPFIWVYKA